MEGLTHWKEAYNVSLAGFTNQILMTIRKVLEACKVRVQVCVLVGETLAWMERIKRQNEKIQKRKTNTWVSRRCRASHVYKWRN